MGGFKARLKIVCERLRLNVCAHLSDASFWSACIFINPLVANCNLQATYQKQTNKLVYSY